MTTAVEIITDAYQRLNRLSPGETLNADDSAFGFTRLNLLVDELSAKQAFLYKSVLTSATVSAATITLAAGSWAAIPSGANIVNLSIASNSNREDLLELPRLTMQQFASLSETSAGVPSIWAYDGLSTIYLEPNGTSRTVQLMTRTGVAEFADQTTAYTLTPGYENYLGAALAVRMAPGILGKLPPELVRAERASKVGQYEPKIIDANSYSHSRAGSILNG